VHFDIERATGSDYAVFDAPAFRGSVAIGL
jgi:hypothetical protein